MRGLLFQVSTQVRAFDLWLTHLLTFFITAPVWNTVRDTLIDLGTGPASGLAEAAVTSFVLHQLFHSLSPLTQWYLGNSITMFPLPYISFSILDILSG
jgi:hypothetical protein